MKPREISLARIGNSHGIRLPAELIRKHGFDSGLLIEDCGDAVVLKAKEAPVRKFSWEETAREMVAAKEDWSEWDCNADRRTGGHSLGTCRRKEQRRVGRPAAKASRRETKIRVKRSDVYWCRFDQVEGSEMPRPCVIVSLDSLNNTLPTVVCPLNSVPRPRWRTRLQVPCDGKPADICAEQIRVISKTRLRGKIGTLSPKDTEALQELLGEMYGAKRK